MSTDKIQIEQFGDRLICMGGIGKMFFQDGFPVSMSVSHLKERGVQVSILHVADECMKNGWSAMTTMSKLKEDFGDDKSTTIDFDQLEKFCNASYDDQREMIFKYLFGSASNVIEESDLSAKNICDMIVIKELLK